MHGDDAVGRAIAELIAAYEQALLLYADVKTRYGAPQLDAQALNRPAPASMRAAARAVLEAHGRVIEAVQRVFAVAAEHGVFADPPPGAAPLSAVTESEWLQWGMRLGRDAAAAAGRGQTLDLGGLRSGKWS